MPPLRLCLVSSEVHPFSKTGGLADVTGALARWLRAAGHDVRLFTPLYRGVREAGWERAPVERLREVPLALGGRDLPFSVTRARLPGEPRDDPGSVWLVDCPPLHDRPEMYNDGPEDALRFAHLGRAALTACQWLQWAPDVVHCHDWHAGLVPLELRTLFAWDRLFARTHTVLTVHNLAYQGWFSSELLGALDLAGSTEHLRGGGLARGAFSFLETGLLHAERVTTVSPTYAREIATPEQGMGLHELLAARGDARVGILNGVDYAEWDPANDPHLAARYGVRDLSGKLACKRDLLEAFGLPWSASGDERGPLVLGCVTRLAEQKGIGLIADVVPELLRAVDARLVVLGSGAPELEQQLERLRAALPDRVGIYRGFEPALAHRIEAGADAYLMPSRYEPCGLNQMYSLRYGTPPVVHATGGLADTVEPWDPARGHGTGFPFRPWSAQAFGGALAACVRAWQDPPGWRRLMRNGMAQDFSWDRQGPRYVELYESLLER